MPFLRLPRNLVRKGCSHWLAAMVFAVVLAAHHVQAALPETAPSAARGEIDLTFTQRSPISTRKELARRLNFKESELGDDYDLPKRPFKAYVPPGYNPSVPYGVFVYLGYKDSESVPTEWEPALDKAHLIFITPVCHHGQQYAGDVPLWQTMGLAFDAVENLKHTYNIDPRRLYLMSFGNDSLRMLLATGDVFTGLLDTFDEQYFRKMVSPNRSFIPGSYPPPPGNLLQEAKRRAIVLLDPDFTNPNDSRGMRLAAMKSDGFTHLLAQKVDTDDVHYPHLKVAWFEDSVLPFLDKVALDAPASRPALASSSPATQPTPGATGPTVRPPADTSGNPEAQHLLSMARLYIQNGQPALARPKLETILASYPKDPAAVTAKQLLATLPSPP